MIVRQGLDWNDFVKLLRADPWPRWRTFLPQIHKHVSWDPSCCYCAFDGEIYELIRWTTNGPEAELRRWRLDRERGAWMPELIASTPKRSRAFVKRVVEHLDELLMEEAL